MNDMLHQTTSMLTGFRVRTMNEDDYRAYKSIPIEAGSRKDYMLVNFGNHLGMTNFHQKQCNICGKKGLECIGHPLVLDMKRFRVPFVSPFGLKALKKLANVYCMKCKQFIRVKPAGSKGMRGSPPVITSLYELALLKPTTVQCGCEGSNFQKYNFDIPKAGPNGLQRNKDVESKELDDRTIELLHEIALIAIEDKYISSLINTGNILNLFYDQLMLLPTMLHVKFTEIGLNNKIHDHTEMIEVYDRLIGYVHDKHINETKAIVRDLTVTTSDKKFLGAPSHIKVMNGKEGAIRDFALNPRAWGTTRAVLTDGAARSGVIQCPDQIMRNQFYTYVVSPHNKKWLQRKVITGEVTHIVYTDESSSTNEKNIYRPLNSKSVLQLGDVVIKRIETGDHIVINRHPTLWKHSMIGYRVEIWDQPCFGLNETNTKGHNADFDGDEGNGLVPCSTVGRVEAAMIQSLYNLFGSHNGDPVVTILYNGIIGMYELSLDDNINPALFERLLNIIRAKRFTKESVYIKDLELTLTDLRYYRDKANRHGINYYSGKTLISTLFPRGFYYNKDGVIIDDGFLIKGKLKSKDISYEIVKAIALIDRFTAPYRIVDVGYTLASEYISSKGMMISANDYIAPGPINDAAQEDDLQHKVDNGTLYDRSCLTPSDFHLKLAELELKVIKLEETKSGLTQASTERTEAAIEAEIAAFTEEYEKLLKTTSYRDRNISKISFMSGARGNIGQVMAAVSFVGLLFSESDRLGINTSRLSYYSEPDSKSIFDRGFVKNSFASGLSPHEVMMLAGPARRAAFKTYLGTPESGHISRQTILHTCGMKVSNSLSTEDRRGIAIETLYGYGCDASYVSKRSSIFGATESPIDPVMFLNFLESQMQ